MLRLIVALVLVAHGIGHSMGILGAFRVAVVNPAWQGDSWILSGAAGQTASQTIGTSLWALSIVGFLLLGGVVVGWVPAAWWGPLAIGSSIVSILGVVLFPMAFPVMSTIGALAVDAAVLVAVLGYGWIPGDLAA